MLQLFDQQHNGYVVDIGCGDGTISSLIQDRVQGRVVGVDVSLVAAKRAKTRLSDVVVADLNKSLPFRNESIDAIFCGSVIEHVFDVDRLMDEILLVMKNDGYCVLTTPNLGWWVNRLLVLAGLNPLFSEPSYRYDIAGIAKRRRLDAPAGHLHLFTTRTLKKLLDMYGCKLSAIGGSTIMERHIIDRLESSRKIRTVAFIVGLFDRVATKFPTISAEVIVRFRKNEPLQSQVLAGD